MRQQTTELPTVTAQTLNMVLHEWEGRKKRRKFVRCLLERLKTHNPEIARYLNLVRERNLGNEALRAGVVYACSVYRMLEVESGGRLPIVSPEIRPSSISEYMRRELRGFYLQTIAKADENLLRAALPLLAEYVAAGDIDSAAFVVQPGLMVFKMLESQIESNRLSESLGI